MSLHLESVIRDAISRYDPAVVASPSRRADLGHKTFHMLIEHVKHIAYWRDDPDLLTWTLRLDQCLVDRDSISHCRPPVSAVAGPTRPRLRERRRGVVSASPEELVEMAVRLEGIALQGVDLLGRAEAT